MRPGRPTAPPEEDLRIFIERAVVPALVERFLREREDATREDRDVQPAIVDDRMPSA
jgi:hypothetical protein